MEHLVVAFMLVLAGTAIVLGTAHFGFRFAIEVASAGILLIMTARWFDWRDPVLLSMAYLMLVCSWGQVRSRAG